jgi:hypothetical protein
MALWIQETPHQKKEKENQWRISRFEDQDLLFGGLKVM